MNDPAQYAITIRFPREIHAKIVSAANEERRSLSRQVVQLVAEAFQAREQQTKGDK